MGRVQDKVAFISGAARGQGRSHAVRLAEEGAQVIGFDICAQVEDVPYEMATPADLEETVRLVEEHDRRMVSAIADVRDLDALSRIAAEGAAELGPIDIVVANAGICTFDDAATMSEEKWQNMIDINLSGVWRTVKASLPHLADNASIVITSSTAGLRAFPNVGHYSAAKHGLVGLARSLAQELNTRGIRVNTVHPTQVETDMLLNDSTYKLFRPDLENPTIEDFKEGSQMTMILPTPWVQSIDISNAVLFLASDEARYITGVALPVDAGASARA
jgi:SDR family mycofactocin-dependent oxidoreductase